MAMDRRWEVEMIGFGLYQSCRNIGSVGHLSMFGLRWCGWCWRSGLVGLGWLVWVRG